MKVNQTQRHFGHLSKKPMGKGGRSNSIPPLVDDENERICVSDTDKYNLFNKFFCSISDLDDDNNIPPYLELRTDKQLDINEISIDEITDILRSLNVKRPLVMI